MFTHLISAAGEVAAAATAIATTAAASAVASIDAAGWCGRGCRIGGDSCSTAGACVACCNRNECAHVVGVVGVVGIVVVNDAANVYGIASTSTRGRWWR